MCSVGLSILYHSFGAADARASVDTNYLYSSMDQLNKSKSGGCNSTNIVRLAVFSSDYYDDNFLMTRSFNQFIHVQLGELHNGFGYVVMEFVFIWKIWDEIITQSTECFLIHCEGGEM